MSLKQTRAEEKGKWGQVFCVQILF